MPFRIQPAVFALLLSTPLLTSTVLAEEIAKVKLPDLNAATLESAVKSIAGTARSMGIDVK